MGIWLRTSLNDNHGFTLIEILIVLVIVGVLATLAAPSFSELVISNRLTGQANSLHSALAVARSEAIKRSRPTCVVRTGTNWEGGWQVLVDNDSNAFIGVATDACKTTGTPLVIQEYPALTGGQTLRPTTSITGYAANGAFGTWLRFSSLGGSVNHQGTPVAGELRLCRQDANAAKSKLLVVGLTGGPVVKTGTSTCP